MDITTDCEISTFEAGTDQDSGQRDVFISTVPLSIAIGIHDDPKIAVGGTHVPYIVRPEVQVAGVNPECVNIRVEIGDCVKPIAARSLENKDIGARTTAECIVTTKTLQDIVAAEAVYRIGARCAAEVVIVVSTVYGCHQLSPKVIRYK